MTPVMSVGTVLVPDSSLESVLYEWEGFRRRIRRRHFNESDPLPKIHMRHLWGRNARRDNGKNPFTNLNQNQRYRIAEDAYDLLDGLSLRHHVTYASNQSMTLDAQDSVHRFHSSPEGLLDREIIYSRFRRDKIALRFFKLIMNPSMGLVADSIVGFNDYCAKSSDRGLICYDTSEASKGFDSAELFRILQTLGWVTRVEHCSHGPQADENLLQMADLVSFYEFRRGLDIFRGNPGLADPDFSRVPRRITAKWKYPERGNTPEEQSQPLRATMLHYMVGRQFLSAVDQEWVERHLKTPEEFHHDFESASQDSASIGVPIVKSATSEHFRRFGKVP